ncbi:MAG: AAA family ATPase [Proteobacteria bacterium]|nr:AAA family ATPase [Pseudomonadota bacterium]
MSLLERESHLKSLAGWACEAANGEGRVVLVIGEAGIGKTSLLRQFTSDQSGNLSLCKTGRLFRILWGGCEALFTPHPLAPLYDIARQVGGGFAGAVDAADRRETVFHLTIEELGRSSLPTILVIEDVHWADEATLDLVKFLGRRLTALGVLLVVSYRDDEVGQRHPLRAVIGDLPADSMRRLELSPLSADAVAWLAASVGRSAAGLYATTCGNPFFITEVLASGDAKVPATVRDAVMARLARLAPSARAVADVASLVPGKAERWLIEQTVGGDAEAIDACLAVGMVAQEDGALAFRHELARRAVEENVPVPHRRDLHARILNALQYQAPVEIVTARLVHHADRAQDNGAVLRLAPLAAARATALSAHREAAAHYETALRYAGALPPAEKADLHEKFSYECYVTDRTEEAIAARQAALGLWRSIGAHLKEGDNLRWLSRLSWFNGQNAAAEQFAKEAIALLESLPPGPELAMAYSNCAQLYMLSNRTRLARDWGAKAIALAGRFAETEILSHAYNNVGAARLTEGDSGGWDDLEKSLSLALAGGFREQAARAYTNLATRAVDTHDFRMAKPYLDAGIAFCEQHDLDSWGRYMTTVRARAALDRGEWLEAEADAEAVIRHPRTAPISKIPALFTLGLLRARRGESGADALLDEAYALARPTGELQRIGLVVLAMAESAWLQGRLEDRAEELDEAAALALAQPEGWMNAEIAFWRWRIDPTQNDATNCTGPSVEALAGRPAAAATKWCDMGCAYHRAMYLADSNDEDDLRAALAVAEGLGAQPLAGILRRRLRAAGVRSVARGAQERHRHNPHGLTTRELGVLAQLTEGLRNADIAQRLFVSEKTIDHHVSSILGKLGVRSRGEAAAMANRLGLNGPIGVLAGVKK